MPQYPTLFVANFVASFVDSFFHRRSCTIIEDTVIPSSGHVVHFSTKFATKIATKGSAFQRCFDFLCL